MTNAIGHHPLCTWFGKTTNSCRLCMRLHLDYPLTKSYIASRKYSAGQIQGTI